MLKKYLCMSGFFLFTSYVFAEQEQTFSWNGNASVISHSSGTETGFGLTQDVTRTHNTSNSNPVVFFQWQRSSNDGKNLKISADSDYTSASIYYGDWGSPSNKKKTYKNVELPFVIDPLNDGFTGGDGAWYTIAVYFHKPPAGVASIRASVTNDDGTNNSPDIFFNRMNLDNEYYWSGNGSLISHNSLNKMGFGLTYDIAVVYPDIEFQTKPSVFFQWEIDNSDGRNLLISSQNNCFNRVRITNGNWHTRNNDESTIVNLPYVFHTNRGNEGWELIRVDLIDKPTCTDYVSAKVVHDGSSLNFPSNGNNWRYVAGSDFHGTETYAGHDFDDTYAYDLNLANDGDDGLVVNPIANGRVIVRNEALGFILVRHHDSPLLLDDGTILNIWYSGYMHMDNAIGNNINVTQDTAIGNISNTGANGVNHLHFAIYQLSNGTYTSIDIANQLQNFNQPIDTWNEWCSDTQAPTQTFTSEWWNLGEEPCD